MKKEFEDYFKRNGINRRDISVTDEGADYLQYVDYGGSIDDDGFTDVIVASEGKYKAQRKVWGDRNVMISLREHDISVDIDRVNKHITVGDFLFSFNFSTGKYSFTVHYMDQGEVRDGMYVTEAEANLDKPGRAATTLLKPNEKPRSLSGFDTAFSIEDHEDRYKLVGKGEYGVQMELDYPKQIDVERFTATALGHEWRDILRNTDPTTGLPVYPSLRFSYAP